MNHVAHCLLSYPDEELLIGNFIGDFVKGSAWQVYPDGVQKGIWLHRFIDAYAEEHPAMRNSVQRIRPFAGRFAAPAMDIVCDYLLCGRWEHWVLEPDFERFTQWAYAGLNTHRAHMPERLRSRWPDMLRARFLHLYPKREGIAWALERFALRLPLPLDGQGLLQHIEEEKAVFEADFEIFFADLRNSVSEWRSRYVV
ncbi:MAG: ACP phosphodiesterase [Saprospiraceae bacterium]|nr:ACP phosphodiesterase [Saprospiraceae bacterium]MDW8229495.1 ACP phosphodiesterase [Saprospiraceae bacterium]